MRKQKCEERNPFENKEVEKVEIAKTFTYAKQDEPRSRLAMRRIRKQDCKNEAEFTQAEGIQNLISKIQWKKEQDEKGGIAWLELFILHHIHTKKT